MMLNFMLIMQFLNPVNDSCKVNMHITISAFDTNYITVRSPYNSFYFSGDASEYDQVYKVNNNFDIALPFKTSSFYTVNINHERVIPIAFTCSDSVSISIIRSVESGYPEYKLKFSGDNAAAHEIFQERFFPIGKQFDFFQDEAKQVNNYSDYFINSKNRIDSLTAVWDSLKQTDKISEDVYGLYVAETKGSLYGEAIRKLAKVKKPDSSYNIYTQWLNTRQVMYYHGQASNPILLKTFTGKYFYNMFLTTMLDLDITVKDTLFKKSDMGYFYYYDASFREWAWGSYLYVLMKEFPSVTNSYGKNNINLYRKYYPNSKFVKMIEQFQDSILASRAALKYPTEIDTNYYQNIEMILSKSPERFVFIDLWATWCQPCIAEFNSLATITKFLNERHISQLFLSIDDAGYKQKWVNFIKDNLLPGQHYMLSQKGQIQMLNILSKDKSAQLSIPRYLLYDKLKNKYYPELPRPSTGIMLQQAIDKIIIE